MSECARVIGSATLAADRGVRCSAGVELVHGQLFGWCYESTRAQQFSYLASTRRLQAKVISRPCGKAVCAYNSRCFEVREEIFVEALTAIPLIWIPSR